MRGLVRRWTDALRHTLACLVSSPSRRRSAATPRAATPRITRAAAWLVALIGALASLALCTAHFSIAAFYNGMGTIALRVRCVVSSVHML
jgi:hypothetical protein